MYHLLEKWKNTLKRYLENPEVAKYMDFNTSLGVQHGRTTAIGMCIQDLENQLKKDQNNLDLLLSESESFFNYISDKHPEEIDRFKNLEKTIQKIRSTKEIIEEYDA